MKTALALVTLYCLASCQPKGDNPDPAETPAAEPAPAAGMDVTKTETLIGQPLEKVQAACDAAKVRHRVVEVDGEPRMVTRDHLPERLNFTVKAGLVTGVTKG